MERFKSYAFREKFLMPVLEIIPNDIAKAAFINGWIIIHDRILRMFVKIIIMVNAIITLTTKTAISRGA